VEVQAPVFGVAGPGWVDTEAKRFVGQYPLSVERYLLNVVARLAPGVTTVTNSARYYALHGMVAHEAQTRHLTTDETIALLRSCEVVMGGISQAHVAGGEHDRSVTVHGGEIIGRGLAGGFLDVAGLSGRENGAYAQDSWGFQRAYRGAEMTLRIVGTTGGLVPGPMFDSARVRAGLGPLLDLAQEGSLSGATLAEASALCACRIGTGPDGPWFAELFAGSPTAPAMSVSGIRRQTLRMIAVAMPSSGLGSMSTDLARFVAYDPLLLNHEWLAESVVCRMWRGVALRAESVNSWRSLWAALVAAINGQTTRAALCDWLADHVPEKSVSEFVAALPSTRTVEGAPAPAEHDPAVTGAAEPLKALMILMLGGVRHGDLTGHELLGFRGEGADIGEELAPLWMARRIEAWAARSMKDFVADLVDVLINRSQRLALRRSVFDKRSGAVKIPTRVHVRDEFVFQDSQEGAGNVSLRWTQLVRIGAQVGLFNQPGQASALGERGALLE
jgi:hypothetical protein